jgi:hypothetical protein
MRYKIADPSISMRSVLEAISLRSSGALPAASKADLDRSIEDVKGWLSINLRTGKCSKVLIEQIAQHNLGLGEAYLGVRHYYQPFDIYLEIEALETGKRTQPKPFRKGSRLHGLLHIHHNRTQFITENTLRYWKQKVELSKMSEAQYWNLRINEEMAELMNKGLSENEAKQKALPSIVTSAILESMDGAFHKTGEWLLLARKDRVNYFLCLALHAEQEAAILERIQPCILEYPFLSELLQG